MSYSQPVLTADQRTEITAYINTYRTKHHAPPLVWDDTIATVAQQWSYNLITTNTFAHSYNPLYGENLTYYQGYGTDVMNLLKKAVDGWYNEVALYDFAKPNFSAATGHFTCLVWINSKTYGIALSLNDATNAVDIVFNTSPPGNVIGSFPQNVLPISPSQIPSPTITPFPTPYPVMPLPMYVNIRIVLNKLNSILFELKNKKRMPVVLSIIYSLIDQMTNVMNPSISIINELYALQNMVQMNKPVNDIINATNIILREFISIK